MIKPSHILILLLVVTSATNSERLARHGIAVSAFPQASTAQHASDEVESYAVYSAHLHHQQINHGRLIVIVEAMAGVPIFRNNAEKKKAEQNETPGWGSGMTLRELKQRLPSAEEEVFASYIQNNKAERKLAPKFSMPEKYVMHKDGDEFEDWEKFYARYKNSSGIWSVSAIGFNSARTQAFFYVSRMCGSLCGGGSFVFFFKEKGAWVFKKDIPLWVS
jgi:hypothetical protein